MPFVQRVVHPVFLSRSRHVTTTITTTTTTTTATTAPTTTATLNVTPKSPPPQRAALLAAAVAVAAAATATVATTSNGIGGGTTTSTTTTITEFETSDDVRTWRPQCAVTTTAPVSRLPAPIGDHELETVTNTTLSNALRQLASLVLIANDIFTELNRELKTVTDRSNTLRDRIGGLTKRVEGFDPKMVAVPEGDLDTFVQIKNHFKASHNITTGLFTPASRSDALSEMYEAAAKTPVAVMREMDQLLLAANKEAAGPDAVGAAEIFICTPVLGQTRKRMRSNVDVDIETRMPAAVEELRRCTSTEAIGDITVTPDCVSRVGQCGGTSTTLATTIGSANRTHSPVSVRSFDETDDNTVVPELLVADLPLDHRLPSPEEQCQLIALKFPAQIVRVDTSGRRFDRMSAVRKSIAGHVCSPGGTDASQSPTTSADGVAAAVASGSGTNTCGAECTSQTVKRRSRSRKPRGKRRNTIAGTDQREIAEAANGDSVESPVDESEIGSGFVSSPPGGGVPPRSKSSDILKSNGASSPPSHVPPTSSGAWSLSTTIGGSECHTNTTRSLPLAAHFNSLKAWGGKMRLRIGMGRGTANVNGDRDRDRERDRDHNTSATNGRVSDIDDFNIHETISARSRAGNQRKLSHERKPSYSSSEKSVTLGQSVAAMKVPASINPVKMRESSAIRRQRRSGLGHKDEPNSSSGNWSASSESGRTSIGSEITVQPKSSASSNSLNTHAHHPGSGPPSSVISRRRFLNTSASSSVTSEGTATPELQVIHLDSLQYDDGETSSSYSCDTEGYYTSFHVDSGLKTLKEEEPVTPLHTSSALSSTHSFSSGNQTVVSAENEYELFGRGSTSTTTSSAGTVCTTLMAAESERSLGNGSSPAVPERKSSLTKLNRSGGGGGGGGGSTTSSCSTLERTGTIKRNGVLLPKEVIAAVVHTQATSSSSAAGGRMESPDSGNNTSSSPVETNSNSSPTNGVRSCSEFEYSESSDLEGVDRIERIRVKTTINSSRIPSLCVITPTNSDDDSPTPPQRSKLMLPDMAILQMQAPPPVQHVKKATLLPLNSMLGILKGVLRKSPNKEAADEKIYDAAGEYVTIADVRNNNQKKSSGGGVYYSNDVFKRNLATVLSGNLNDTEYVSLNELPATIRCEATLVAKSKSTALNIDEVARRSDVTDSGTPALTPASSLAAGTIVGESMTSTSGARVTLDANGKVIYNSDSLKRRKGAHTTFNPGPFVKEIPVEHPTSAIITQPLLPAVKSSAPTPIAGGVSNRKPIQVRPVVSQKQLYAPTKPVPVQVPDVNNASVTQPQAADKIIIRAVGQREPTAEIVRMAPVATTVATVQSSAPNTTNSCHPEFSTATIATASVAEGGIESSPPLAVGAYVNVQQDGNVANAPPLSQDYQHLSRSDVQSATATLPRPDPAPFERDSNVYWTLQPRRPLRGKANSREDAPRRPTGVEDLYAIPNKAGKQKPSASDLKTTQVAAAAAPLGFASFFSPAKAAEESARMSPIDPRTPGYFKTSTPTARGTRSSGSSPISSGRSTPQRGTLEPQPGAKASLADISQTCSDRLGTPKTSLMDFKKLLLATAGKSTIATFKPSAVEQLRRDRAAAAAAAAAEAAAKSTTNTMSILDLSASPKMFASRRMIRAGNFGSPSKTILSTATGGVSVTGTGKALPRAGWRGVVPIRSDVMISAIPEANSEEDNSSSGGSIGGGSIGGGQESSPVPMPKATSTPVDSPAVVEESISLRENIFLKSDENNFMRGETPTKKIYGISRAQILQAQRAQFLSNTGPPAPAPPTAVATNQQQQPLISAQFKNGHYTGISATRLPAKSVPDASTPSLETSL